MLHLQAYLMEYIRKYRLEYFWPNGFHDSSTKFCPYWIGKKIESSNNSIFFVQYVSEKNRSMEFTKWKYSILHALLFDELKDSVVQWCETVFFEGVRCDCLRRKSEKKESLLSSADLDYNWSLATDLDWKWSHYTLSVQLLGLLKSIYRGVCPQAIGDNIAVLGR